ncbi:hypothetical protein D3C76_1465320 [compost metagenome]
MVGLFLVHIPNGLFVIHHIRDHRTSFFIRHPFPDLNEVVLRGQRKDWNGNCIGAIWTEVNITEAYMRLSVATCRYPTFVAVTNLTFGVIVQSARDEAVWIFVSCAQTVCLEFQLGDEFRFIRTVGTGCAKPELPVTYS